MAIPIAVGIATPTHAIPKAFGRAEKSVVFQEVFYDSPLTEDSNLGMPLEPEIYQGEYILLWNSSDERIDLSGWTVENEESSETKHLSGYLDPGERMLLANSDDGDLDHFYAATQLPLTIINDSTFIKVYFEDSLTLWDNGGQLRLKNASGDVEDAVDYGSVYNLEAENDFVPDSLLDSLYLRNSLSTVRRTSISAVEPPQGDYEPDKPDPHVDPLPNYGGESFGRRPGEKLYELKNHLGNVLAVVSDLKLGQDDFTADTAQYYFAQLMSAQDYYPFGWLQPNRKWNNPDYRYGFNGKEKDDEWSGNGNNLDYGFRMQDTRLGRFLSVDPLAADFPWYTPYQFAGNKPINSIDLDGLEDKIAIYQEQGDGTKIKVYSAEDFDGPLGKGTYVAVISSDGTTFTENFTPGSENPISSFEESGVSVERWGNGMRLNARLVEKTSELMLVDLGFDKDKVEQDVQILESDNHAFKSKFSTLENAEDYISDWEPAKKSSPHKSETSRISPEVNESNLLLKYYDGASDPNDDAPPHLGIDHEGFADHVWNDYLGAESKNVGAENAQKFLETKKAQKE